MKTDQQMQAYMYEDKPQRGIAQKPGIDSKAIYNNSPFALTLDIVFLNGEKKSSQQNAIP